MSEWAKRIGAKGVIGGAAPSLSPDENRATGRIIAWPQSITSMLGDPSDSRPTWAWREIAENDRHPIAPFQLRSSIQATGDLRIRHR